MLTSWFGHVIPMAGITPTAIGGVSSAPDPYKTAYKTLGSDKLMPELVRILGVPRSSVEELLKASLDQVAAERRPKVESKT